MVGSCADDSDSDSLLLVISGIAVNNVDSLSAVEIVFGNIFDQIERGLSDRHVDFSPADVLLSDWISDDSLG